MQGRKDRVTTLLRLSLTAQPLPTSIKVYARNGGHRCAYFLANARFNAQLAKGTPQSYSPSAHTTRRLSEGTSLCARFAQTSFFIDCIIAPFFPLVNRFFEKYLKNY